MQRFGPISHDPAEDRDQAPITPMRHASGRKPGRRPVRQGGQKRWPGYPIIRLNSWDEYLEAITDSPYANWAFRGAWDENWPLFSSLSRYFHDFHIDPKAWRAQEERSLRIFKRQAHLFLDNPPKQDDDFEWLALMQHHGAPTRLVDFTWSPYVAALFALERATADAAVWAVNPQRTKYTGKQKLPNARVIDPLKVDPRQPGNLEKYFLSGGYPFVWIGEPQIMNRRLIAQSGTFAVPGVLDRPLDEILAEYTRPEDTLVKFVLPAGKVRERGMRELYRMKVTYANLFPDLDGLARSIGYELEFHWAYDPRRK